MQLIHNANGETAHLKQQISNSTRIVPGRCCAHLQNVTVLLQE